VCTRFECAALCRCWCSCSCLHVCRGTSKRRRGTKAGGIIVISDRSNITKSCSWAVEVLHLWNSRCRLSSLSTAEAITYKIFIYLNFYLREMLQMYTKAATSYLSLSPPHPPLPPPPDHHHHHHHRDDKYRWVYIWTNVSICIQDDRSERWPNETSLCRWVPIANGGEQQHQRHWPLSAGRQRDVSMLPCLNVNVIKAHHDWCVLI